MKLLILATYLVTSSFKIPSRISNIKLFHLYYTFSMHANSTQCFASGKIATPKIGTCAS